MHKKRGRNQVYPSLSRDLVFMAILSYLGVNMTISSILPILLRKNGKICKNAMVCYVIINVTSILCHT